MRGAQWVGEKSVFDVRQGEFLVLLLVAQTQHDAPCGFLIDAARKKSLHLLVNVCTERKNFIERRPREDRAQAFFRNFLTKRVVIAVEKPMEFFPKRFVAPQEWTQHKRLEKPCGMSLVPFHGAGFRTRLDHLIFGRKAR